MTPEQILVFSIAGIALLFFLTEWIPLDITALLVLASLGLTGIITLPEMLLGFGSPVIMTFIGIFMLTGALRNTGFNGYLAQFLLRLTRGSSERRLVALLSAAAGVTSLLMNTVASVALVAPVGRRLAEEKQISPSRLLMPIAFGALLGGMGTLLTTSNLIVSGLLAEQGFPEFSLLSFLPVGVPIALVGIAYLTIFSPILLPERNLARSGEKVGNKQLSQTYDLPVILHKAIIEPDSPLIGRTLRESALGKHYGITVSTMVRGKQVFTPPETALLLEAGDWFVMQGDNYEIEEAALLLRLVIREYEASDQDLLYAHGTELAEIAVTPRSAVPGRTLAEINFREKWRLNILGIWHGGEPIQTFLADHRLAVGDALLVQGRAGDIKLLQEESLDFLVLTSLPDTPDHPEKALIAVTILGLFLVVIGFGWLPVPLTALIAGLAVVLTRCLSVEQARSSIRWEVIFLIAGMFPLGSALNKVGATQAVTEGLISLVGGSQPWVLVLVFFSLTAGLSQLTSGQAATLIIAPLALSTAVQYGVNPQALAMVVGIGASTGFLSPVAHPANMLVMGPGGYRFSDYSKLGFPLVLIAASGAVLLIPLVFLLP